MGTSCHDSKTYGEVRRGNVGEDLTKSLNLFLDHTYPVHGPRVTLLTQVVLHLGLQPHAVKVLPDLQ